MGEGLRASFSKAYYLRQLREFPEWSTIARAPDATRAEAALAGEEVVLVHDDYSVTLGLFRGEAVLAAGDGEDWKRFCRERLGFRVPPELIEK